MGVHGDIHWSELISGDVAASKAFFQEICGWQVDEMEMPGGMIYNVCKVGDRPVDARFAPCSRVSAGTV